MVFTQESLPVQNTAEIVQMSIDFSKFLQCFPEFSDLYNIQKHKIY